LETLTAYPVDTFLLDTEKTGFYGGTGETFDWSFAKEAKAYGRIVLSGGIGPDNVAEAVREVKPYAVDCGSGVEAEPGRKDHEKVARFLGTVRSTDR
jgi:phosphoribosylanthranilate isomerase